MHDLFGLGLGCLLVGGRLGFWSCFFGFEEPGLGWFLGGSRIKVSMPMQEGGSNIVKSFFAEIKTNIFTYQKEMITMVLYGCEV